VRIRHLLGAAALAALITLPAGGCSQAKTGDPKMQNAPKEGLKPMTPGGVPGKPAAGPKPD